MNIKITFIMLPLVAFICFSSETRAEKILKNKTSKTTNKVKKTPSFNKYEKEIISLGGSNIVKNLRKYGYKAESFLKALKYTVLGIQLYNQGDFGDSIFIFKRSYRIFPSPGILYWIAKSNLKFGNVIKSRKLFSDFLKKTKTWKVTVIKPEFIKDAELLLSKLEKNLASLILKVNVSGAEIAVNGIILRKNNKTLKTPLKEKIWLNPGYNRIVITKKGYVARQIFIKNAKKGKTYKVSATLLTPKQMIKKSRLFLKAKLEKAKLEKIRKETEAKLYNELRISAKEAKKRRKTFLFGGYTVTGIGVSMILSGIVFGIMRNDLARKFTDTYPDTTWNDLKDDYEKYDRYGKYSFYSFLAGGLVSLAGALIIHKNITPSPEEQTFKSGTHSKTSFIVAPFFMNKTPGLSVTVTF